MKTWVMVADATRARLFELNGRHAPLTELQALVWPESRLKAHEIESDRPGRAFDSRGGGQRHAMEPGIPPKQEEATRFARSLVELLQQGLDAHSFEQLCVMAPPQFLGLLRAAMGTPLQRAVTRELVKDLTHEGPERIADEVRALLYAEPRPVA
jgi:protein required for attachment to host cells